MGGQLREVLLYIFPIAITTHFTMKTETASARTYLTPSTSEHEVCVNILFTKLFGYIET